VSEAILYQGTPLNLNNSLINSQYLDNLACQDLVLQSIPFWVEKKYALPEVVLAENPFIKQSTPCSYSETIMFFISSHQNGEN